MMNTEENRAYNVLLVEDDVDIWEMLSVILLEDNVELTWARTGRQAMSKLTDHRYDLVMLDLGLPDINGFDVLRAIKGESGR